MKRPILGDEILPFYAIQKNMNRIKNPARQELRNSVSYSY